jgi:hypothetical protein
MTPTRDRSGKVILMFKRSVVLALGLVLVGVMAGALSENGPGMDPNGSRLANGPGMDPDGVRLASKSGMEPNGLC